MSAEFLQNQAWRRMFASRTCPPVSVLAKGGELVQAHLASCANCRDTLARAKTYAKIGELLAKSTKSAITETKPHIGEIRRITPNNSPDTFFDKDGRYHNPPLVLVLTEPDDLNLVKVAQIYDEPDLMDEGDIDLGDLGIAQAWNVYNVPVNLLAKKSYAKVPSETVELVLKASRQNFSKLDSRSALYNFRVCEVENSSFFASSATFSTFLKWEEEQEAKSSKVKIHPFKAKSREIFKDVSNNWDKYIDKNSLALAAADSLAEYDPRSTNHGRLPCIVALLDAQGEYHVATKACDVQSYVQENSTVCTIDFKSEKSYRDMDIWVSDNGVEALDDIEAEWIDDKLEITANFAKAVTSLDNLKISLIFYLSD